MNSTRINIFTGLSRLEGIIANSNLGVGHSQAWLFCKLSSGSARKKLGSDKARLGQLGDIQARIESEIWKLVPPPLK